MVDHGVTGGRHYLLAGNVCSHDAKTSSQKVIRIIFIPTFCHHFFASKKQSSIYTLHVESSNPLGKSKAKQLTPQRKKGV